MKDERERIHRQDKVDRIIQCVQECDDPDEMRDQVSRIVDEPIPPDETTMNEDTMGVSMDVIDPCGPFGSIEDLQWYMGEYPECFDDPYFFPE